ncbi:galactokinase [Granulosicoccus antarcticus]|uniref:Galactokinase n=1 Tax=Granulosicoccus antarcticus IMCC3135 TaxID=1192854 RepID=A0A2Z2NUE9_9GAMM|nr:galactokinase family protein [Granulosicoccus antarcticus]ASJ71287.1 Galactokinase [Granulosicoccus antarcticus IMCC3135]
MSHRSLSAPSIDTLTVEALAQARQLTGIEGDARIVVSPYRFNPLGAHIDHQGGAVLARCLNQYTILVFWPSADRSSTVHACLQQGVWQDSQFEPEELVEDHGWDAMARASVTAFANHSPMSHGITAVVTGTLVSGGLSSSASVILAYLSALAEANDVCLSPVELVELARQVENDYRGLNNGIQDQMSIAFGERDHLSILNVEEVSAELVADPDSISQVCFLMCYSGISRDLAGSPFNTRVAQCLEAARLLSSDAASLGEVPLALRTKDAIEQLPSIQARRARHVYSEMQRVRDGALAWKSGDWQAFGQMMNMSCQSSINDYESGSEWLIALHEIASQLEGVYGNRFSGGGYGGCLFMLVDVEAVEQIADTLLERYLARYPELQGEARIMIAESESTVRIVSPDSLNSTSVSHGQ